MYSRIKISPAFCLLIAMMLLCLPLKWLLGAVLAAAFHELCHITAIYLLGGRVDTFALGQRGAVLDMMPLPPWKELLCALAGPVGGLLLLLFARWIPRVAICAAFQSLFNCLPIYPNDGGRAVRCLLRLILPKYANGFAAGLEWFCLIAIAFLALYATFILHLGVLPMAATFFVWLRKSPCKERLLQVQ